MTELDDREMAEALGVKYCILQLSDDMAPLDVTSNSDTSDVASA